MNRNLPFCIKEATAEDVPLILQFIREHAEYEKALDKFTATEEILRATLFGDRFSVETLIAYAGEEPAAFAIYFFSCSSYSGLPNLYLEDIFVRPEYRRLGIGKELLAHIARRACERGCGRMEWAVLDWNEPAIGFYKRLGAASVPDWIVFHLPKEDMEKLAEEQ